MRKWINKIVAVLMMAVGCIPLFILGETIIDATYLLFLAPICIMIFFAKEEIVCEDEYEEQELS